MAQTQGPLRPGFAFELVDRPGRADAATVMEGDDDDAP